MSFFDYTPPPSRTGWSVSASVWIYFVCAVPLTGFTLGVWFWGETVVGVVRRIAVGHNAMTRNAVGHNGVGAKALES